MTSPSNKPFAIMMGMFRWNCCIKGCAKNLPLSHKIVHPNGLKFVTSG